MPMKCLVTGAAGFIGSPPCEGPLPPGPPPVRPDALLPLFPPTPQATKLAAEQLCRSYAEEHGLALVVLRYFSVYGPRQRPDMGYHRFIHALLHGQPVTVYGDGLQARGNTYVEDCVEATVAALAAPTGE